MVAGIQAPACSVAFRFDFGPEIGIGHLRRCLTLAGELHKLGCGIRFVCRKPLNPDLPLPTVPYPILWLDNVSPNTTRRESFDEEIWDADATLSVIGRLADASSWVVLDHFGYGCRWQKKVRDAGYRIAAIDDGRDRKHHADLLVSDSTAPFDPELNELAERARVLVGREYALVDTAYAYSGSRMTPVKAGKRILVTYGGADPTGESLKALEAIRLARLDGELGARIGPADLVIGPANLHADAIASAADGIQDVTVHRAPPSLDALMRQADLILTAGGNSMVEALALRKPCIVTVTGDNQALMVNELVAERGIRSLGRHTSVTACDMLRAMARVLDEFDACVERLASRPLFDHLGAQRIASAMLAP